MSEISASDEQWKDVIGFEGCYQVSSLGRVKSLERLVKRKASRQSHQEHLLPVAERFLRLVPIKANTVSGYYQTVVLWRNHEKRQTSVHILVAEAFLGSRPTPTHQCCNKDGNGMNNRLENLYWGTPVQNNADKRRHGTHIEGEAISWSKLKKEDVMFIRASAGLITQDEMAKRFNVCQAQISRIVNRKEWNHV